MPLAMMGSGQASRVVRITGRDETRHFLESLGFVSGNPVTVLSEHGGDLIIKVCDSRVAISRSLASKIHVA